MATTAATNALVDCIARDIQAGGFAPGTWLKQIDLQRRYGKPRSHVRRALEMLAHKRLLQYLPNRGYYIYAADDERAGETLSIRIMLETGIADAVVANAGPEHWNRLEALAATFAERIDDGALVQIYEANLAFHKALLSLGGNALLVELVDELRLKTSPAPTSQWTTRARIEQSSLEHFAMVEAIAAGDAGRLRRLIRAHIEQSPLS